MRQPAEDVQRLAESLVDITQKLSFCPQCCNIAETGGLCEICGDARRDATIICVVEDPRDVAAVERSGVFHGTYHVLHGVLNPLEGISPERLRIKELIARLHGDVKELIFCLNPTVEGTRPFTICTACSALRGSCFPNRPVDYPWVETWSSPTT
jgi:recombination protein RecR